MTTYNGYTNYETWKVNLEMIDGLTPSDLCVLDPADTYLIAGALKDYCEETLSNDGHGLALSFALAFLDNVDWKQIAELLIEAYADA